jgi:hypothetical protein
MTAVAMGWLRSVLGFTIVFLASGVAGASPITINSSSVYTCARTGSFSPPCDVDTSTAYSFRVRTASAGAASSTTFINWIDTGSGARFDFDFAHVRPGVLSSGAELHASYLIFTATADTSYAISGQYSTVDVGAPGYVAFYAGLFSQFGFLLSDTSSSQFTPNESFTLGVANDGDTQNGLFGSLTGTLQAGVTYAFQIDSLIRASRCRQRRQRHGLRHLVDWRSDWRRELRNHTGRHGP